MLIMMITAAVIICIYAAARLRSDLIVLSATTGLISFFAAEYLLSAAGITLPLNPITLLISVIGGIPGTLLTVGFLLTLT